MAPQVTVNDVPDKVKLIETKSSSHSILHYAGNTRRGTEISIFLCDDGHKFHSDNPKSNFDTSYIRSISSFQKPTRSKMATCCFALTIMVIIVLVGIALTAGIFMHPQSSVNKSVSHSANTTPNILASMTDSSSSYHGSDRSPVNTDQGTKSLLLSSLLESGTELTKSPST